MVLPIGLQRQVDSRLRAHISKKPMNKENFPHDAVSRLGAGENLLNDGICEHEEPSPRSVVAERILTRRSVQMRSKQQDWEVIIQI